MDRMLAYPAMKRLLACILAAAPEAGQKRGYCWMWTARERRARLEGRIKPE